MSYPTIEQRIKQITDAKLPLVVKQGCGIKGVDLFPIGCPLLDLRDNLTREVLVRYDNSPFEQEHDEWFVYDNRKVLSRASGGALKQRDFESKSYRESSDYARNVAVHAIYDRSEDFTYYFLLPIRDKRNKTSLLL